MTKSPSEGNVRCIMHVSALLRRPTRLALVTSFALIATAAIALPATAAPTKVFDANNPHHSTAVDSGGKVHIASEKGGSGVWYITNKSGSWTNCQVSDGNDTRPAIAINGSDVHIAFARFTDGQKGIYTASSNVSAAADSCGFGITKRWTGNGYQPALAARGDTLSIAFRSADKKLRFIKGDATDPSWTIQEKIDGKCCTSAPSIGLTASGSPRVLYGDGSNKAEGLKFAVRTSKGWKKQKVHGGRIKHVDMAIGWGIDPFTHTLKHGVHVAYVKSGKGTYHAAKGNVGTSGGWDKRYLFNKTMPPQVQNHGNITKVIHGKSGNIWYAYRTALWYTTKLTNKGTDGKPQLASDRLTFSRSGGIYIMGI